MTRMSQSLIIAYTPAHAQAPPSHAHTAYGYHLAPKKSERKRGGGKVGLCQSDLMRCRLPDALQIT
jgi:hypothetical protein